MKIQIISLFPEMLKPVFESSMLWKAQNKGIAEYAYVDLRDFGNGRRKTVDDTPYGGGDGMLLMLEPMLKAVEFAKQNVKSQDYQVILPTPRGQVFKQSDAKELAASYTDLIFLCPRYEGYDERIVGFVDRQYCIGNYVLTGGELPAMVMADSVIRLLPGVLGGENSVAIESFQNDDANIEFPQYTRPEVYNGLKVPDVLLSGNHAQIEKWRKDNSR